MLQAICFKESDKCIVPELKHRSDY